MKRVYLQKIRSNKILVSIMSMLLILSFILETSPTDVLALTRSAQNMTTEQSDGLEYQTISSFPGKSKAEIVTLDGLMPVKAEVNVQSSKEYTDGNLFAYDISITDQNGEEFQPVSNDPIKVEITNKMIGNMRKSNQKLRLWHIDNDGLREEIKNFTVEKNKIIFEASGFSVYEVDNGTPPLRTYKFLMPSNPQDNTGYSAYYYPTGSQNDNGNYKMVCSQTIKNGEKLIFPQLPADIDSKYTFVGWFVGSNGTPIIDSDHQLDFNNIPAVTQNETVELYAVFESCVYAIFHEQYNGKTGNFPVFATRRSRMVSNNGHMEATFNFDDLKVVYDDENKEEGAPPSMQFKGWTTTRITSYPATEPYTLLTSQHTFAIADAPDKSIRLYPVFEPIRWLEFDSNGLGATYIPPKSFPKDEGFTFSGMTVPVREGYDFAGWYTEKTSGTLVADANNQLNTSLSTSDMEVRNGRLYLKGNTLQVELHAHWTPGNSKYTVIIWRQKESDDRNDADEAKTYDYAESESITAITGTSVSLANRVNEFKNKERNGDYTGFYYSRCDNAKTVSGNGSTVLNVYYDRCTVKYKFLSSKNNNATTLDTWTGLYGQKITKYNYSWNSSNAWKYKNGDQDGISYLEAFNSIDSQYSSYDSASHTYTTVIYKSGTNSKVHIYHVLQDLNGNYDINNSELVYDTRVPESSVSDNFNFTNKFEGFTVYGYSHGSFTPSPSNNAAVPGAVNINNQNLYVYHKRRSHTLEFVDSVTMQVYTTETVLYQAPIGPYKPADPTTPSTRPGYEFTDWYFDQSCGAVADFSNMTMPNANMIVYAGWETIWYKIEIDPNGGQLSSTQSTFFWEPYNGDPIEEYKTISRNYEPDVNGSYYYALHNRAYWHLTDEWNPIEDENPIHDDRGAFYTTDITKATSETRYRQAPGAYRYLGWYEVDPVTGEETPYNFGTRVVHDTYLRMHWKQLGTYHIKYDAGEGTIDGYDMNEATFEFLDAYDYADHAEVVVTRVAKPVDGKNFVGWRMKHDPSGRVYYPGQTFQFSSAYAESITQVDENTGAVDVKRTIIMEAVYEEIKLAKIIYDANGGTITDSTAALDPANAGGQITTGAPFPVNDPEYYANLSVKYSVNGTQLTVSDLLNNSAVRLSNGAGFANRNYVFLGWSTTRDGSGSRFDVNSITTVRVDNNEPMILYAQWEVKVYFDRNDVTSGNTYYWGNGTDDNWRTDSKYKYDENKRMYYTTVRLNGKVNKPSYTPTSSSPDEMFSNWSLEKQGAAGVMKPAFDFGNTGVTQQLIDSQHNDGNYLVLHACWKAPIRIPVYYVDTSKEDWYRKDDWRKTGDGSNIVLRDSTHVSLANRTDADGYAVANVTDGFEYAFATESGKDTNGYQNITENVQITEIWYDSDEMCVKAKYSDNTIHEFDAANDAVYLVYYKSPEYINIGYDLMYTDGTLSSVNSLSASAPRTANVVLNPQYNLPDHITQPIEWTKWGNGNNDRYHYYSFAIGKENAATSADLKVITGYKTIDSDRPALQVRNNWNGFEYSYDGNDWYSIGYDIALYAVYYEWLPTIVKLREETIALLDKMGTEFNYTITVNQTETKTVTRTYYYKNGNNYNRISDSSTYPTTTTPSTETTTLPAVTTQLSDGQSDSYVVFYSTPADPNPEDPQPYIVNGVQPTYRPDWWSLTTYYVYYRDAISNQVISQTIDITQAQDNHFSTTNNAAVSGDNNVLNSKYTSTATGTPVTITYTNRQKLEKTVNVAVSAGGGLTAHNDLRTTDPSIYQHDFTNRTDWNISDTTVVSPSSLINNNSDYVFLGIITGTGYNNSITKDQTDITKLSFGEIAPGAYGYYLNDDKTQLLGDQEIWFVYAKKPTIKYVYQKPNGDFVDIETFTQDTDPFSRATITNGETVPVNDDGLRIAQISTPSDPAFLIPDLLDYGGEPLLLDLNRVSVGDSSAITDDSDSKKMEILFADGKMQYRFHDGDTPTPFEENPVIYAVYKLKGYELTLTKKVLGDSSHTNEFTFEISSDQLTHSSYETTIGTRTVTSKTMSITIGRGQSITIYGLTSGTYTIRETTHGDYTMTAKINGSSQNVTNNTTAVLLTDNTEVEVLNTYPIPITGGGEKATPYVVVTAVILLMAAVLVFIIRMKGGKRNELSSL